MLLKHLQLLSWQEVLGTVLRWLLSHQVGSKGACSSPSAINSATLQLNKSQVQTRGRLSRQAAGCSP